MNESGPGLSGAHRHQIVVGVGTRRGVSLTDVRAALAECLAASGVQAAEITAIVTIDRKRDDPALLELSGLLRVPLTSFAPERLALQRVPSPAVAVERLAGTPSVAEAAVLAAGARLLVPKQVRNGVTIALGVLAHDAVPDALARSCTAIRPTHEMEPR